MTRQQAKAGLGLLGISGRPDDAAVIVWLGLIEELTLYSVVALKNLLPEADLALCDLAQQVNGRGRIHCVYRLKDSTLPEVRHWLLHGGYQNGVMTEEVAYIAATADDLRAALDTEPDDEILDHAGALLEALAYGGPAEDMTNYSDGQAALAVYLTRMATAAASLERAGHLNALDRYLHGWAGDNPLLSAAELLQLRTQTEHILAEPRWQEPVQAALASDDLAAQAPGWWLHIDLDVLARSEFTACGAPDETLLPGGLAWSELTEIVSSALRTGGCRGWSIAVDNPDLEQASGRMHRRIRDRCRPQLAIARQPYSQSPRFP